MKKRYIIFIILGLCLISHLFLYLYSSHQACYNSVTAYNKDNPNCFYDFYLPDSYLDNNKEKQTIKDFNKTKIYYNDNPKDNYNITYKIENIEFTYFLNKQEEYQSNLNEYQLINNIYYHESIYHIEALYFLDNGKCLSVGASIQDKDSTVLKDIVIQILKESIELNK